MTRPLIIAAALLALGLPTSATANEFAGIVANDVYSGSKAYRAKQLAAQQAAGVGIIRQTLDWASVEVAPNSYDFTNFDNFVEEAARHNIRVLPVLFGLVAWRICKELQASERVVEARHKAEAEARLARVRRRRELSADQSAHGP